MKNKRPIVVVGDNAYVHLTKGYMAIVDAKDVHLVSNYNWCALVGKNTIYAVSYNKQGGKTSAIGMHELLLKPTIGKIPDHKDGNGLNNRRNNLREATYSQNNCNARKRKNATSDVKGVSYDKVRKKWKTQLVVDGVAIWSKRFNTEEEAAAAYATKSKEYHKDFSKLN